VSKVLVTGGAGFIGSHTVDLLLQKGYVVRVLDSLQKRVHPRGQPDYLPAEAEFIEGNVANARQLEKALEGIRYVLHMAAYQDYQTDFSRFIRINTESTARIFELIVAKRLPVEKIVLASSQAVAGEGKYACAEHGEFLPGPRPLAQLEGGQWDVLCPRCGYPGKNLLIDESTADPHTAYAISKYALELLAFRLGQRYNIPAVAMRYTYVQGPRNSFYNAYSGILRIFTLRLLHGRPPIAFEDGRQLRDYVNVRDVAAATVLALERPEANFQVLNVGGGRPVTVLEFARIVLKAFGSTLEPEVPRVFRLGDTRHTISDITRMRSLGWEPRIPIEQSVREYVEWARSRPEVGAYFLAAEREMRRKKVLREACISGPANAVVAGIGQASGSSQST
jgi:dTDP-L-rhamnose 4-epimerase